MTLAVTGDPRPLPGGVDLAGYRIVQEALTNALKHAGAGTGVAVELGYRPSEVCLEVVDDGAGRGGLAGAPLPGGHGLPGMRERVAVYGGVFEAGPRPGAGWRVRATIPVPAAPAIVPGTDAAGEDVEA